MSAGLSRKSRNWDSATTMKGREGSGIERQGAGTGPVLYARCASEMAADSLRDQVS